MKKFMSLVLAGLMTVGVLASCGKDKGGSEGGDASSGELKGSIVFATTRNDKAKEIQALVDEFTAAHQGTSIEVQVIGNLEQEMRILMSAKELPDVSPVIKSVKSSDLPQYYEPIDDLGFTKENLHFYSSGVGNDNKLYSVTSGVNYEGMVYNKKVFKEAGITDIPRTMEDFWAACEKIKALGVVPVASNFKDSWPLQQYAQKNAGLMSGNGNYLNTLVGKNVILEENGMLAGLKFLAELNDRGYLEPDLMSTNWEGFKGDIAVGRAAMANLGDWFPPQAVEAGISADDIGMMPLPYAKAISMSSEFNYAVSNYSKNKPLAKAFLKWLWEDGRYAKAIGINKPVIDGSKADAPWLNELLSFDLPIVEMQTPSDEFNSIVSKAQYDFNDVMAQEYVLAADRDAFVKEINSRWEKAQK